jgi:Flp pilus assembly pilin Flp
MKTLDRFVTADSAAAAIEYCLIATLISIVNHCGRHWRTLNATYTAVGNALK